MQEFNLKDIAEITDSQLHGKSIGNLSIIITNSRNIDLKAAENGIFFAIKGTQHNGHDFINELYEYGVRAFVVTEQIKFEDYPEAGFIKTKNSILALQQLAGFHRKKFNIPVTGITGSNGKTIVKEWLHWLLMQEYNVIRSPQSYNSQIGVPLSLMLLDEKTEFGIFEAGISQPGEMDKLERIIKPEIGVITNIGSAHQQNFISLEEKIKEKIKLFEDCSHIVYCKDDLLLNKNIENSFFSASKISWSENGNAYVQVKKSIIRDNKTSIILETDGKQFCIEIPFTDRGSFENTISCFCTLIALNIPLTGKIIEAFNNLPVVAMRLEIIDGINNSILINDTYNSDINSLNIALDFLNQKKLNKQSVLILSDILQNSQDEQKMYSEIAELIGSKKIDKFIGIGNSLTRHKTFFQKDSVFYTDTISFISHINNKQYKNSCILLKGARSFGFEKISKVLQQKSHETLIEVNLNLMKSNLEFFRQKSGKDVKTMVVVKAFSYGNGYYEIADFLQYNRVDYLAVAYADEGVELRKRGISLPIMVMNPGKDNIDQLIEFRLEPEIFSLSGLKSYAYYLTKYSIEQFPVHLKIDTGMHRLGFMESDIDELIDIINKSGRFNIVSIFSHLIGSDKNNLDNETEKQIKYFTEIYEKLTINLNTRPLKHILNSSGILRFPQYCFDMVRLGIGLYGLIPGFTEKLYSVSQFKTKISQIRRLKKNQTVGYNKSGILKRDSIIATIPVGYADGLDRRLGNGNWQVMIKNEYANTVGEICMDMCMIDITNIQASEGDEVIIFGENNSVIDMAERLDTIPYEVITNISERVKRIYTQE